MPHFKARYVFRGGRFEEGLAVHVVDGRVDAIAPPTEDAVDLGEVALFPGLVNAHSHAFQRAIRGRTEFLERSRPHDDFWTWRQRMYDVAHRLTPEEMYAVARWTFLEMALTGITSVGEFHYVHHQPDGTRYDDPNELAQRVIAAARDVGIRICLLRVAYHRGGFDREPSPEQRRFVDPFVDHVLRDVDALRAETANDDTVTIGLAPHSIRAVGADWLRALSDAARRWDTPLHIHACEQRREIDECLAEFGAPPIEVFDELGLLDERLTLIHATHLTEGELDLIGDTGANVCACPTTERNLGDGFLPASELVRRNVPIALGSDSHTNIDLWEDARLVEYHERLRLERRNVLARAALDRGGDATTEDVLWPMLTKHGAKALRLETGDLSIGAAADFVTLDLQHPTLIGADAESLLAHVLLSMTPDAVRDVYVAGAPVIVDGRHPRHDDIADGFSRVIVAQ